MSPKDFFSLKRCPYGYLGNHGVEGCVSNVFLNYECFDNKKLNGPPGALESALLGW